MSGTFWPILIKLRIRRHFRYYGNFKSWRGIYFEYCTYLITQKRKTRSEANAIKGLLRQVLEWPWYAKYLLLWAIELRWRHGYLFCKKIRPPCLDSIARNKSSVNFNIVLSAAQYSQVIRIFDMFTSCYKMLSYQLRINFII